MLPFVMLPRPLFDAGEAELPGAVRGLVFRLAESLGAVSRAQVAKEVEALGRDERRLLRGLGVEIGRESLYYPALLKPAAVEARAILWSVAFGPRPAPVPHPGRVSLVLDPAVPPAFLLACGYRPMGELALRLDMVERIAERVWDLGRKKPFAVPADLLNLAGCGAEAMAGILTALGLRPKTHDDGTVTWGRRRKPATKAKKGGKPKPEAKPKPPPRRPVDPDSPFAVLEKLLERP